MCYFEVHRKMNSLQVWIGLEGWHVYFLRLFVISIFAGWEVKNVCFPVLTPFFKECNSC